MQQKQVKVVIGAQFGDEGKGLMTDYFASRAKGKSIVVRHNGGAQAGHTVVTPEGAEHVFSHFGSGSFVGAPTFLSRFFIANPLHFVREDETLNLDKIVYLDPHAMVSTPLDMMINQIIETLRGDSRHGSCGYGIEETVRRTQDYGGEYAMYASDLLELKRNPKSLIQKIDRIQHEYVQKRLAELGVKQIPSPFDKVIYDKGILESFIHDCEYMMERVTIQGLDVLSDFDDIIFEGAQGLLLDQDAVSYYPHVTSSSTGLANVNALLQDASWEYDLEAVYATRCYSTRHGAGRLDFETKGLPYPRISDPTNKPNAWQGSLRFGYFDVDRLVEAVHADIQNHGINGASYTLAVTCLDQVDDLITFTSESVFNTLPPEQFVEHLQQVFPSFKPFYESWGRTRSTIKEKKYVKNKA